MCYEKLAGNDRSLDTEERKMTEPLISIIVPVYRVESYLSRCVDSLLAQTYQNLEIILVDDGSPISAQICEDYAKKEETDPCDSSGEPGLSGARMLASMWQKVSIWHLWILMIMCRMTIFRLCMMIKATGWGNQPVPFTYTKGEKLKENRVEPVLFESIAATA